MEVGQRIIKQESTGNDLVASGRITFPPTLLPPRRGDELFVARAANVLSMLPLLGKKRNEKDRADAQKEGNLLAQISCMEPPLEQQRTMNPNTFPLLSSFGKRENEWKEKGKLKILQIHPNSHPNELLSSNIDADLTV